MYKLYPSSTICFLSRHSKNHVRIGRNVRLPVNITRLLLKKPLFLVRVFTEFTSSLARLAVFIHKHVQKKLNFAIKTIKPTLFSPCKTAVDVDEKKKRFLSSCHCACVFIAYALLPSTDFFTRQSFNSIEEVIEEPRPRFSDSALRVAGDSGAGGRENRGREAYGRREKKGREAGSLRWREAGEKFKKARFRYLLLLTSSQRSEPNNVS